MRIFIRRLFDQNNNETGAILSVVFGAPTNIQQKTLLKTD